MSGERVKGIRPRSFSNRSRLDLLSSLCISWFASELCLNVTVLCCSTGLMSRTKIEQRINLKFLVKLERAPTETKK
jgi:hypothetical protein